MNLDILAQEHVNHCNLAAGYATSTHAGVAAVLRMVAADARCLVDDGLGIDALAARLDEIAAPR
jgi:hypothetical protein